MRLTNLLPLTCSTDRSILVSDEHLAIPVDERYIALFGIRKENLVLGLTPPILKLWFLKVQVLVVLKQVSKSERYGERHFMKWRISQLLAVPEYAPPS